MSDSQQEITVHALHLSELKAKLESEMDNEKSRQLRFEILAQQIILYVLRKDEKKRQLESERLFQQRLQNLEDKKESSR
jgi:hypothetical protein